jgi:hypothetical protein
MEGGGGQTTLKCQKMEKIEIQVERVIYRCLYRYNRESP